jgi:hypothetical protein
MENVEVLRREIKALAFDQYGTIVDMQKGLADGGRHAVSQAQGLGGQAE